MITPIIISQPAVHGNVSDQGAMGLILIYVIGYGIIFALLAYMTVIDPWLDRRKEKKRQIEHQKLMEELNKKYVAPDHIGTGWADPRYIYGRKNETSTIQKP